MEPKTTDLKAVIENPRLFTWGKVVQVYTVSRYTLVEFEPQDRPVEADWHPWKNQFQVYVDGKDQAMSEVSLERALVLAISIATIVDSNEAASMSRAACKVLSLHG